MDTRYFYEFKEVADEWFNKNKSWIEKNHNFFNKFKEKDFLENLKWEDIQELGNHINAFNSLALAKGRALGKPNHPIEHYRDSFMYLIYGEGSLKERIDGFRWNEKYKLFGFGESVISEIVGNLFPEELCLANQRDIFALEEILNIDVKYARGDSYGEKYIKFNDAIKLNNIPKLYQDIVGKRTDLPLNYEIDQFFSYLYETYKDEPINSPKKYGKNDILQKVFIDKSKIEDERVTNKSQKEVVEHILNYITSQGYIYDKELISNLYLSLKTKPFVILAGISGTGKSKIVRLFAESLGATVENNQFNMISVRPDWNDSTELIGYKNLESKFIKGKLTQIIEEASRNLDKPYFICLDEMNLARVEYYLSDYLSVIESRRKIENQIITDKLIYDSEIDADETLSLPENLYIVGTVNMDDTTFQFSRKVLDRANTIEFSDVNLENLFGENSIEDKLDENIEVYNDFLKSTYLKTMDIENEHRDYAKEINKKIIDINEILKKSQKQFAYRVRDEILFYMIENKKSNLLEENEAFDYQIMQKVLPAICGSENSVKETLVNLFNFICENEVLNDSDIDEAEKFLNSNDVKYKKSAEKIIYMLKGYNYDGYASYWY